MSSSHRRVSAYAARPVGTEVSCACAPPPWREGRRRLRVVAMLEKIEEALLKRGAARIDRRLQRRRDVIFSWTLGRIEIALLPPAHALEEECKQSTI